MCAFLARAEIRGRSVVAGGVDVRCGELNQEWHAARAFFYRWRRSPSSRADHRGRRAPWCSGRDHLRRHRRRGHRVPCWPRSFLYSPPPLIRARATLAGNLATASPIGDGAPALLALEAEVELASVRGRRRVAIDQFFAGYRKTVLEPDELIVAVRVPARQAEPCAVFKVSKRARRHLIGGGGVRARRRARRDHPRAPRLTVGSRRPPARALRRSSVG